MQHRIKKAFLFRANHQSVEQTSTGNDQCNKQASTLLNSILIKNVRQGWTYFWINPLGPRPTSNSWPNRYHEISRCEVPERSRDLPQKTRALRDSSQHPFWPKWADRAQNSPNVVTPWSWSGSAAFCRTYSGMIDFSVQKVNRLSTSNEVKHSRDFETSCDYRIQMDAGFVTAKKQTTTTTST